MKALNDLNILSKPRAKAAFSKAANSMDMTPAAISASIKRLEGQIGFPLFVRSTRSLRLTSEGELFLDKTTQALATLQEVGSDLKCAWRVIWSTAHYCALRFWSQYVCSDWVDEFIDLTQMFP